MQASTRRVTFLWEDDGSHDAYGRLIDQLTRLGGYDIADEIHRPKDTEIRVVPKRKKTPGPKMHDV
jgi:hypothetical protein